MPSSQIPGLRELAGRVLPGPVDPGEGQLVRPRPMGAVEPDDLGDRRVVHPPDLGEDLADRVLVPSLRIRVTLDPAVVGAPASSSDQWDRRPETRARRWRMAIPPDIAIQVAPTAQAAEAKGVLALDDPAGRPRPPTLPGGLDSRVEPGLDDRGDPGPLARPELAHVDRVGQDLADVGLGY